MKKKIIVGILASILILAGVTAVVWYRNDSGEKDASEIKAGAGEELVYATINQIMGNDMDVTVLDNERAEQIIALRDVAGTAVNGEQNENVPRGENRDMATMADVTEGGRPGMGGGGNMPEMGGGMPDMNGGNMPEMSEGNGPDGNGKMPGTSSVEETVQTTSSYRIPVGTDVITTLGATTTFSHLEEGDTIAILKEQNSDTILKIWMIM